ncbi:18303_t:CDS:2 [Funneliformis geosporum]|nr:18303_t:CDS:2 [Funneliformis geosporum]
MSKRLTTKKKVKVMTLIEERYSYCQVVLRLSYLQLLTSRQIMTNEYSTAVDVKKSLKVNKN